MQFRLSTQLEATLVVSRGGKGLAAFGHNQSFWGSGGAHPAGLQSLVHPMDTTQPMPNVTVGKAGKQGIGCFVT